MTHTHILVVGGTGFIGRELVAKLAAQGRRVIVPTRRRERARALILLPGVEVVEADVMRPEALRTLVAGCDAAINLVGILHGRSGSDGFGPDFARAHIALPTALAQACADQGVRRLIHISALGVTDGGERSLPSRYLRSKAAGEAALRSVRGLDLTILRPSVVFGADDAFLNLFGKLQAVLPVVALAGSEAKFQPIWVGDVAQAAVNALDDPRCIGQTYPLAGPEIFTLRQLVQLAGQWAGHTRPIIGLPRSLGRLVALGMECAPGAPLMTRDNIDSMSIDNVSDAPIAPELGITPASLRALGPMLYGEGFARRLGEWRERAGR